jgi:hypothetical protein
VQLVHKFQLKELFWKKNNVSSTIEYRNKVWSTIDKRADNIKYRCNKNRVEEKKTILADKMKPIVKLERWIKFLQSLEENEWPDFDFEK